jgi:triosephosphate isomerase
MGKKIVAGNWKMNLEKEPALKLASEVVNMASDEVDSSVTLVMCVPFIHLSGVKALIPSGKPVYLGAQNCYQKDAGAFTGEISAPMLKSFGVSHVILGHSERRQYFAETNAQLAEKVNSVLAQGMIPIFCCGEVLAEREAGAQESVVEKQLRESLFHLSAEAFAAIVIAYEPVWAIGTGKTASSAQAQEMHAFIRGLIGKQYGETVAAATSILYGGSCNPQNAPELFACPDVDGGLIGGASLKSRDFIDIAKSFA